MSFPMRGMEGHISHCSRVSRRCYPERSLCSGEFGCRLFIKYSPWTVCFLLVVWKTCVLNSLNISVSDSVLETKKLQAEVLNLTCRNIQVFKLLQNVNFDGLTFLTALVLYSQSGIEAAPYIILIFSLNLWFTRPYTNGLTAELSSSRRWSGSRCRLDGTCNPTHRKDTADRQGGLLQHLLHSLFSEKDERLITSQSVKFVLKIQQTIISQRKPQRLNMSLAGSGFDSNSRCCQA